MISAGRVLIMPKGEYDASTTYSMLDLVSYNGSSYVAKRSTTGNLPTNTTYWQLSAYGGSAANMAANFAQIETTDYASKAYSQGDYLVNKDGQFCKVIVAMAIGDEINSTNTEVTSVEEVIADLTSYVDGLDAEDAKITGKTAIAGQTDLHTLGIGNYYKTNTSVYVTNAPTGIDSVPTAKFRLTVENTNNAVSDSTKILTLRTFDGKTYTQAYDGTTWSDWKLLGDNADVPTYIGATSVSDGVKGLFPGASIADRKSALLGDGSWVPIGTAASKDSTNTVASGSTDLVESGAVYTPIQNLTNQKANKTDLTNISQTGITATQAIPSGTFFYLNGALVRAKTAIASGATFTANTNYEAVTAGALNASRGNARFGISSTADIPITSTQKSIPFSVAANNGLDYTINAESDGGVRITLPKGVYVVSCNVHGYTLPSNKVTVMLQTNTDGHNSTMYFNGRTSADQYTISTAKVVNNTSNTGWVRVLVSDMDSNSYVYGTASANDTALCIARIG